MKIFIETKYLKQQYYQPLIDAFPEHEFTVIEESECEIIIGMFDQKDCAYFDQFTNLRLIMLLSAGFDHLDLEYFKRRHVIITNARGVYDIQIAEDVVSKMLYFNKKLNIYYDQMKNHVWKHHPPHYELYRSQALILGAGSIGHMIAKRLKGFDMDVIGYKQTYEDLSYFDQIITKQDQLNEYYKTCDYLIISLPLNKFTERLIDKEVLSLLKKDAVVINIGRGEIIDQSALINALNLDMIRGAALDVTYPEPLSDNHLLWNAKNIYITPHNSSDSLKVHERRVELIVDLLDKYFNHNALYNIVL